MNVSYPNDNRQLNEQIQTLQNQNIQLAQQNEILKQLARAAADSAKTAEESAKSSEKSAKHSKVCTFISVVIAGLMFAATVIEVVLDLLNFFKT